MDTRLIVERTAEHVRNTSSADRPGHDWWHSYRVWKTAVRIGTKEGAGLFVVELAALLHDVADWKFHNGDTAAGPREARAWLQQMQVEESVITHVCQIIEDLSFKGAGVPTPMKTLEGMVVQDADRIDALGAIGIARAFAYGGYRRSEIHDPNVHPTLHSSFEGYRASSGTTINHFYEKLLLLKDLMNTAAARAIAEKRHNVMQRFLETFLLEWDGKA